MRPDRLFLPGLVTVLMSPAGAQRVWLAPDPGRNISFEVDKGFFKSRTNLGFASFIVTAAGRFPMNNKLAITAAIPVARISEVNSFGVPSNTATQTAVGNPWLGVEVAGQPGLVVEAGIRPGTATGANEAALVLGFFDDFDRFEAWSPKVTSVRAIAHIGRIPQQGSFVTGILGATLSLPNDGSTEYYANYGIRAGFLDGGRLVSLAVTGRAQLSHLTQGGSLDQRTVHQLGFSVEGTRGRFRPDGSIRTYLDESFRNTITAIVTLGASFTF